MGRLPVSVLVLRTPAEGSRDKGGCHDTGTQCQGNECHQKKSIHFGVVGGSHLVHYSHPAHLKKRGGLKNRNIKVITPLPRTIPWSWGIFCGCYEGGQLLILCLGCLPIISSQDRRCIQIIKRIIAFKTKKRHFLCILSQLSFYYYKNIKIKYLVFLSDLF